MVIRRILCAVSSFLREYREGEIKIMTERTRIRKNPA
jgi:hypothetical protein